jgi:predicted enzyme related to lactoylglutathione lyase
MIRGIGGVFIYAQDAERLVAWYTRHLGIEFAYEAGEGSHYKDFVLPLDAVYGREEREVFAIRQLPPGASREQRRLVINWRVQDLTKLLAQLQAGGVAIDRSETYEYGRFAWLTDPEGNVLELFEPAT